MPTLSPVDQHRRDLNQLVSIARNDLRIIVDRYDDAAATRDALLVALPTMVQVYGSAAATLAANWYDEQRDAAGITSRFLAIPAELPDLGRTAALARWGTSPLFSAAPDKTTATTKLGGGLQRIVADAARLTVTASSIEDRHARGWKRVTHGGCDFCISLADIVFDDLSVRFESHDDCECVAVPIFG